MLTAATYLIAFLVLGNLLAFAAQPGRDLKASFQQAQGTGVLTAAMGVGFLIQAWGLAAMFALKARWPEWAFLWALLWWLCVIDLVHQIRLLRAWGRGESEAGAHLNGWPYKTWAVLYQIATLAAAIGVLWPEN